MWIRLSKKHLIFFDEVGVETAENAAPTPDKKFTKFKATSNIVFSVEYTLAMLAEDLCTREDLCTGSCAILCNIVSWTALVLHRTGEGYPADVARDLLRCLWVSSR